MLACKTIAITLFFTSVLFSGNAAARIAHYPYPSPAAITPYSPHTEQPLENALRNLLGRDMYAKLLGNPHFLYLHEWLSVYAYQQRR